MQASECEIVCVDCHQQGVENCILSRKRVVANLFKHPNRLQ